MILAAVTTASDGSVIVRTLVPPLGSSPGDAVSLATKGSPSEGAAKQMKTDDWKRIVEKLSVQVGVVFTYPGWLMNGRSISCLCRFIT